MDQCARAATGSTTRRWKAAAGAALLTLILWAPGAFSGELFPDPGPRDRCPVCGMFVGPHGAWLAAATLHDGSVRYFDGPKDLFRFVFDPGRYEPGRTQGEVERLFVTEYYSAKPIDARTAYFVVGSDVLGPMGHELVPVKGLEEAKTFAADHRGTAVLSFTEVTPAVLAKLQ